MRGLISIALLSLSFLSPNVSAFETGQELLFACESPPSGAKPETILMHFHCIGYLSGMYDSAAQIFDLQPIAGLYCPPSQGIAGDQIIRVVLKFLEDNPEQLHESARSNALIAFSRAFPCE